MLLDTEFLRKQTIRNFCLQVWNSWNTCCSISIRLNRIKNYRHYHHYHLALNLGLPFLKVQTQDRSLQQFPRKNILRHRSVPDTSRTTLWFVEFFAGHSQGTNFKGEQSDFQQINASIIQGSGLGPATYVVNATDLVPKYKNNTLANYADVPADSISTRQDENHNIEQWSLANNLKLNR